MQLLLPLSRLFPKFHLAEIRQTGFEKNVLISRSVAFLGIIICLQKSFHCILRWNCKHCTSTDTVIYNSQLQENPLGYGLN
jgi:hypothetical protein